MEEHKVNYFQGLVQTGKEQGLKSCAQAKCKFYTSSKELHQIVNTLSNNNPPKILPTIYPSSDLPSIFIKHFTNKVGNLELALFLNMLPQHLLLGQLLQLFLHLK